MLNLRMLALGVLLAATVQADDSLALLVKTAKQSDNPALRAALLKGMLKGLEGRRNVPAPEGWSELGAELTAGDHPELKSLARKLGQVFGDKAATVSALALVRNPKAKPAERRSALHSLLAQQHPGMSAELVPLLDQPGMRLEAIRAFGKLPDLGAAELVKRWSRFNAPARRMVVETLATRKDLAEALVAAMENGIITPRDVPAYLARPLTGMLGDRFTKVYGVLKEPSADKKKLITRYSAMLDRPEAAKADPAHGRVVYDKLCGACHLMFGEGGRIGPDLTGSNRANRDYILLNIVDPNFDVPDAYKMVILKTRSGQDLAGTIAEEDERRVVLKTVSGSEVIPAGDITSRQVMPFSMMPEGMLEAMPEKDFFALIKYLQTTEQVKVPKS